MYRFLLTIAFFIIMPFVYAQSITPDDLGEIRNGFQKDASTRAVQNVLTSNKSIRDNALNHELQGKIDHYFKYRVNVKGITNQKNSGRCWMFTSMNVLRPGVIQKYDLNSFDFSHNYAYFWDIFEKSNLFLENVIATRNKDFDDREVSEYFKSPVNDGGVWNLYYNISKKYGAVPQEIMPETEHSNNTTQLISIINEKLRLGGYSLRESNIDDENYLRTEKINILKDVYRILALCLGEPPVKFTWRFENTKGDLYALDFTPLDFYKSITPSDFSPENYIMIMNDPTREYYKIYEIQNYRNTVEGINWVYLNLPNQDIKKAALASIKANEALYASCDVGKQFNRESGILDPQMYDYESLLGVKLNMDKKARILTRQSGSSHAMTLIGCDTDEKDCPVKWEFENSWGTQSGHDGYLTFTDKWFDEYMFRIVIHKKYLNNKAIQSLKQKPILLPVWDYMY